MACWRVSERSKDGGNYGHIYLVDFVGYILKPRMNSRNHRPSYKYYVPVLYEECNMVAAYHLMCDLFSKVMSILSSDLKELMNNITVCKDSLPYLMLKINFQQVLGAH